MSYLQFFVSLGDVSPLIGEVMIYLMMAKHYDENMADDDMSRNAKNR